MKITVFGGSGFLGSHICDKLSGAGHAVTIVDLHPSPWLRQDQTMITGNILDEDVVHQAVQGADMVFNYAGIADIGEANSRPVDTARINVVGNVMVLEACRQAKVRRYVFASSLYVYGQIRRLLSLQQASLRAVYRKLSGHARPALHHSALRLALRPAFGPPQRYPPFCL